jgi:hypothetical protein
MDKFLDKLCDLIVKCARFGNNVFLPLFLGFAGAYFIALLIFIITKML